MKWNIDICLYIITYVHIFFSVFSSFFPTLWLLRWTWRDILFFATASGCPLWWKSFPSVQALLMFPNLLPWLSDSGLATSPSEGAQWLPRRPFISTLLCSLSTIGTRLLHPVYLELLQGLAVWRGGSGGRRHLCWQRFFGQLLAHLCITELF